jgi:mono/diheme cytochrome c family protein
MRAWPRSCDDAREMKRIVMLLVWLSACQASTSVEPPPATLIFRKDGAEVGRLDNRAMQKLAGVREVSWVDPAFGNKTKRYWAAPLVAVLNAGFGSVDIAREQLVFRALDGYTVPVAGARLVEPGGYLAFADLDVPAWEQMPDKHAGAGPFYLVWIGAAQSDAVLYPRPYQIAEIGIARYEDLFPHTLPASGSGDDVQRGFAIFKQECIHCHAINREGGHLGPDLNVPQSIVEYRPIEQVKAYIKNPYAFRYTSMPPHPQFTDADLDGLVAYFRAMSSAKHDNP